MTTYYREWASKVNHRKGRMLSLDALKVIEKSFDPGYMSVFMFDEASAKAIELTGSSKGMNKYPVYSNEIMIDIDTGLADLHKCFEILDRKEYGYLVYSSGHKGYHITIPLDRMYYGTNVPYSQRTWVEINKIPCDLSLYQAGRLISMPGRIHPVTKARKALMYAIEGKQALMTLVDPPAPSFDITQSTDTDSLKLALAQMSIMSNNSPIPGNRHQAIWSCGKSLSEGGVSFECALELLSLVNESFTDPKDSSEVERAVRDAYGEKI